jgi:hypothetical protein
MEKELENLIGKDVEIIIKLNSEKEIYIYGVLAFVSFGSWPNSFECRQNRVECEFTASDVVEIYNTSIVLK